MENLEMMLEIAVQEKRVSIKKW
uniref:Uncharacterized protein n=1 Tax=Moniliophthora roreri TaxID=221103 RepID=A0A0W0F771_MONRR